MSTVYWSRADQLPNEGDIPANQDNPLPTALYWGVDELSAPETVNMDRGLPVQVVGPGLADVAGRLVVANSEVLGIPAADAEDAGDTMGILFALAVPRAGCIVDARFIDIDFEGLAKEVWLFNSVVVPAANDAAFSITDEDLKASHVGTLTFSTYATAAASEVSRSGDTPMWYVAPSGFLYAVVKTLGADNIAAGKSPWIKLTIERYSDK